jgi:hypothetical protein
MPNLNKQSECSPLLSLSLRITKKKRKYRRPKTFWRIQNKKIMSTLFDSLWTKKFDELVKKEKKLQLHTERCGSSQIKESMQSKVTSRNEASLYRKEKSWRGARPIKIEEEQTLNMYKEYQTLFFPLAIKDTISRPSPSESSPTTTHTLPYFQGASCHRD